MFFFQIFTNDCFVYAELNNTDGEEQSSSDSETAIYFILSLYLLSLFIPLIVVWIVNICTIKSYSKRQEVGFETNFEFY